MNLDVDPTEWLALASAAVAAVGTYLPWIVTAPGVDMAPTIYLRGMGWRVAGADFLVLGALAVGLAAAAGYRQDRRGGHLAAATGVLVAVASITINLASIGGYLGTFVPGPGVAVTVAGCLGLLIAGWRHRRTVTTAAEATPEPSGH